MKTVAILQSNYIPWRGYFDLIRKSGEFILLDSVQYTRRDWRNRNIIKTANGPQWLTIPVAVKGRYDQAIDQTEIAEPDWAEKHIRSITVNYRRAKAYDDIAPWLYGVLRQAGGMKMLADSNRHLLAEICGRLKLTTPLRRDADILPRDELIALEASQRLLRLCQAVGANCYLSGPSAKNYLDVAAFSAAGIAVEWMQYGNYSQYPQCWGAFEPHVSVIDLLLNCGESAAEYLGGKPA